MTAEDVIELYSTLLERGIQLWLAGGWGIDALLQRQTRSHTDLAYSGTSCSAWSTSMWYAPATMVVRSQVRTHAGYVLPEKQVQDLRLLREQFCSRLSRSARNGVIDAVVGRHPNPGFWRWDLGSGAFPAWHS